MNIINELKKRIRELEAEQSKQQHDLLDLDALQDLAEVNALEQDLIAMNEHEKVLEKQRKINNIKLESEKTLLRQADRDAIRKRNQQQKATKVTADVDISLEQELLKMNQKSRPKTGGYRICLSYKNNKTPSEWSDNAGGGWHSMGEGDRYMTLSAAKNKAKALKRRWPQHPITVVK